MTLFEATNLVAGYPQGFQAKALSLKICDTERVGVTGPNGSGKTVLMKTILGLIPPLQGKMSWQKGLRLGFVPQFHDVNPVMPITVAEVLDTACRNHQTTLSLANNLWQIDQLLERSFHELSGGQKQKVLITRMLLLKPDVIIMDEPTNHMDATSLKIFWDWLKDHPVKALVLVEHDLKNLEGIINRKVEFGNE